MAHAAAITTLFLLYNDTNRFSVNFFHSPRSLLPCLCMLTGSWEKDSQATFISLIASSLTWRRGGRGWEIKKKKKNSQSKGWKKNIGRNVQSRGGKIRGEEKGYCSEGGFQGASSRHSQLEQTNGRQTDSAVSNGREARCALDVSLHLSFSKCCFVCSPLNMAAVPPNQNTLYLLPYIITSHSRPGSFATLTNVADLLLIVYDEQHRYGGT